MAGGRRAADRLTHVDETGAARMVDVSAKDVTSATRSPPAGCSSARRSSDLLRGEGCPRATRSGSPGSPGSWPPSGPPTSCRCATRSRSAGSTVDLEVADDAVEITATVRTTDRTGVEMEALTAVSVAALTVVDMVKAVDKAAAITDVRVESKTGGKSGDWSRRGRREGGGRGGVEPRGRGCLRGHHRPADRRGAARGRLRRRATRSSSPTGSRWATRSAPRSTAERGRCSPPAAPGSPRPTGRRRSPGRCSTGGARASPRRSAPTASAKGVPTAALSRGLAGVSGRRSW